MAESKFDKPNRGLDESAESVSRRGVLLGAGALALSSAVGCGDSNQLSTSTSGVGGFISGAGGSGGQGAATSSSGTGGQGGQAGGAGGTGGQGGSGGGATSCTDSGGLSAEELLAPIETIVVLCMENRSFDHYFGSLSLVEGKVVNGLTGNEVNPDPDGNPVPIHLLQDFTVDDPPHDWNSSHEQWNNGNNDGFVIAHAGNSQNDVMGYHVREQLQTFYTLADSYTLCDQWYASVMGPTWPNRFYLHGATSKGQKSNLPVVGFKSIFQLLNDAGISHKNYYHDVAWASGGYGKLTGLSKIENFFEAAANGTLPQYCLIDPHFFGNGANDDHPDHDIQLGQALIASVYAALAQSPQWNKILFVITYDEHGGFFDHVAPPVTTDDDPDFTQLGFRVPGLVAGPFVRKGCFVSTPFDHVSVLRTLQRRFNLPSLNDRMSQTNDLSSCIDPAFIQNPQPPTMLPKVKVSISRVFRKEPRKISQKELWAMAEAGLIAPWLDRRSESDAITRRVLDYGVQLGAVELVD
ncbi:MAG: alkaline phosphatase family protein [Polyangiaceae bacterium]|nr:alkaline phosphatase family protein [Polyangiaceae bacterium]